MDKKSLHLVHEIRKKLKERNWGCIKKNCKRVAIKSHLLQENGILNLIAYNPKAPLSRPHSSQVKPVFVNVIPRESSSIIIIGYAKGATRIENIPVDTIKKMSQTQLCKLISDILIKRVHNWCVSPNFFEKMKVTGKEEQIIKLKEDYFAHPDSPMNLLRDMELEFNLFED